MLYRNNSLKTIIYNFFRLFNLNKPVKRKITDKMKAQIKGDLKEDVRR